MEISECGENEACGVCDVCLYLQAEEQARVTGIPFMREPDMEKYLEKYRQTKSSRGENRQ